MKPPAFVLLLTALAAPLSAQTADSIIAKYIEAIGGPARIQAVHSLRRTGRYTGGGGFEAVVVQENQRPNSVREEFSIQGMTGINAYDGHDGWKIEPWQGKRDPEALGEEEMHGILDDADFDGPLVNYQAKGNRVEYQGIEQVEGSDAYKLKVNMKNGTVRYIYLDADTMLEIKNEGKRMIRGSEVEFVSTIGDYKEVGGLLYPYSIEMGAKDHPEKQNIIIDKIEINPKLDDARYKMPAAAAETPGAPKGDAAKAAPGKPGLTN